MRVLVEPVRHIRDGKAQVYLRPEANRLLEQAIRYYGKPIYPTGSGSAGRTYEQQLHYWNLFQAGGPVASHPDHGPNPHRRYGALDIDDQNARTAMIRAGWVATTPSEWWHFEHPDCRDWSIVTDPYTLTDKENPVSIIRKTERGVEWSLFAPLMAGPIGTTPDQLGYRVTGTESTARIWCDMYGIDFDSIKTYTAADYQRAQAEARAIAGDILNRIPAGNLKPVLDAVNTIPTKTVDELRARL